MKRMIFALSAAALLASCGMEEKYQKDMDRVRITHIDYLAGLLSEYREKTGQFPLQDRAGEQRVEVFITHRPLDSALVEQTRHLPMQLLGTNELREVLEHDLGRTITLPSDPQNVPTYAPNIYIYDVTQERACVAGHLYSTAPGAHAIPGQRYFKYEHCLQSGT